jgi:hypothetical protein
MLDNHKDVGIIGVKISNIPKPKFHLRNQGKLRASGVCVGIYTLEGDNYVDWIPGLSLSIRMSSIKDLFFDERRVGNSIGEDADFCIKAGLQTKIMWTDKTHLKHSVDPSGRYEPKKYVYASNYHRFLLMKDHPNKVKRKNLIAHDFWSMLKDLLRALRELKIMNLYIILYRTNFLIDSSFYTEDALIKLKMNENL